MIIRSFRFCADLQNEVESKPKSKKMTRVMAGGVKKPEKQPKRGKC